MTLLTGARLVHLPEEATRTIPFHKARKRHTRLAHRNDGHFIGSAWAADYQGMYGSLYDRVTQEAG